MGIPHRCAKRDVPRAFKWHFLRPRDVPEFAVRLAGLVINSEPSNAFRMGVFFWEFVAWSAAAWSHHGSFRSDLPEFNDVVPFESKWVMDDGVVVVGARVYQSLDLLDETMKMVWVSEGLNVEKMAEEGEPSSTQLLWGLHMNFDTLTVTLPLSLLQEVIGCAQYWSVVCPALTPHLPSLYEQGQAGKKEVLLQIEASDHYEREHRWEDFWDALDFVRLQLESPLATSFSATFEKLLPIRERLVRVSARTRITGGDATLSRIGAVDWTAKVYHASDAAPYSQAFTEPNQPRPKTRRRSSQSFGLCVRGRGVQRLETEMGFSVHPIYIRTYRNQLADWLTVGRTWTGCIKKRHGLRTLAGPPSSTMRDGFLWSYQSGRTLWLGKLGSYHTQAIRPGEV